MKIKVHHRTVFTVTVDSFQFDIKLHGGISYELLKNRITEHLKSMPYRPKSYEGPESLELLTRIIIDTILTNTFNTFD